MKQATMVFMGPVANGAPGARPMTQTESELARLQAEVARLRAEHEALRWAASHDELTGLPNRRLFLELAPGLIDRHAQSAIVMVADLDNFKPINDSFGHHVGDDVLRTIAQRVSYCASDHLVARLGGDEFAGVLTCDSAIRTISTAIAEPIRVAGRVLRVTASLGLARADGQAAIGELLHRADMAMYAAKRLDAPEPPAPTHEPYPRDPATVLPADTYRRGDPVWVYRDGAWRPGMVEAASALAVMCRYRRAEGAGTVVDTMAAEYVVPRERVGKAA